MNFKKYNFISLASVIIMFFLMIFSNVKAINYNFKTIYSSQNLQKKEPFTINLNLSNEYSKYLRLHPFICKVKFDKNLFDFQKVTVSKNIRRADLSTEILNDEIIIKFSPKEARIIPFSSHIAEILKVNFICKCTDSYDSYFETTIINTETCENIFSDSVKVSIEGTNHNNRSHSGKKNTKSSKNLVNNKNIDCRLKSISPSEGNLSPSFDPNIFNYELTVPKETQEIYFDVTPINESTAVKINRHKLGSKGTITYINITCKNKSQNLSYLIKVKRNACSSNSNEEDSTHNNTTQNKKGSTEKSKKKSKKRKSGSKNKSKPKDSLNELYDDEAYENNDFSEDDENLENEEQNNDENKEIINCPNSNKTYLIFSFIVLTLCIAVFLLFKLKLHNRSSEKDKTDAKI